jgi:riboflavin kinase / FMN adenylyltransferase
MKAISGRGSREKPKFMEIFRGISKLRKRYPRPVVAIGVLDGVHKGHQKVIGYAVRRARQINGTAMVMTFAQHPVHVLRPHIFCPLIVSVPHRLKLIAQMGVDISILVHFTKRFSRLSPDDFIQRYLVHKIRPSEIVVGNDFHFGQERLGTAAIFRRKGKEYGFDVCLIKTNSGDRKKISSSRIRRDIAAGDLKGAARLLGRPFSILGRVVHGDARGRGWGYPTANIHPAGQLVPPSGVYIVEACLDGHCYPGIANVGRRPTFKRIASVNLEVHLFDFRRNLYGKEMLVRFYKRIRDEKVFRSEDELVRQIRCDEGEARRWFTA